MPYAATCNRRRAGIAERSNVVPCSTEPRNMFQAQVPLDLAEDGFVATVGASFGLRASPGACGNSLHTLQTESQSALPLLRCRVPHRQGSGALRHSAAQANSDACILPQSLKLNGEQRSVDVGSLAARKPFRIGRPTRQCFLRRSSTKLGAEYRCRLLLFVN